MYVLVKGSWMAQNVQKKHINNTNNQDDPTRNPSINLNHMDKASWIALRAWIVGPWIAPC